MFQIVTALCHDYSGGRVVEEPEAGCVSHSDISIVANDEHRDDGWTAQVASAGEDAGKGAGVSGALGSLGGTLAGLGLMPILGLEPVVRDGRLASTLGAAEKVSAAAAKVGDQALDACGRATEFMQKVAGHVNAFVPEQPHVASNLAVATDLLVGLLIAGRDPKIAYVRPPS